MVHYGQRKIKEVLSHMKSAAGNEKRREKQAKRRSQIRGLRLYHSLSLVIGISHYEDRHTALFS